jgi:hypothetical protein
LSSLQRSIFRRLRSLRLELFALPLGIRGAIHLLLEAGVQSRERGGREELQTVSEARRLLWTPGREDLSCSLGRFAPGVVERERPRAVLVGLPLTLAVALRFAAVEQVTHPASGELVGGVESAGVGGSILARRGDARPDPPEEAKALGVAGARLGLLELGVAIGRGCAPLRRALLEIGADLGANRRRLRRPLGAEHRLAGECLLHVVSNGARFPLGP